MRQNDFHRIRVQKIVAKRVEGTQVAFPPITCEKSRWTHEYRLGRVQKMVPWWQVIIKIGGCFLCSGGM